MAFGILKKTLPLLPQKWLFPWKRERKARSIRRVTGGVEMSEIAMLRGTEPREILQTVIEKKIPAIMSYLSKGKWYVAKVVPTELGANRLVVEILPKENARPINIQAEQPVGISLKYGYGKMIFETRVLSLEPSPDGTSGGTIAVAVPDRIEIVQRRSYFRVDVPNSLKVNVLLWHRGQRTEDGQMPSDYWQGRLVDISAGGAQVAVGTEEAQQFKNGQFIGLRFTPMPYEMPLMLNAQIRSILPTVDGKSICLGLQVVGLEASPEGHQTLQRLCNVVERYYEVNRSGAKQQDYQRVPSAG
jgi:c-di-GMP-binding flagellar brake protein YcgR